MFRVDHSGKENCLSFAGEYSSREQFWTMMRTCGLRQSGLFGIPSIHGVRALAPSIVDDCLREVRFCRTLMSASGSSLGV